MSDNFGLKIGLEGEREFKKSLSEINQSFKVLGSEMKLVESQFDKNDNSIQALTARNDVLQKSIDAQKGKIEVLRSALENAAKSFGENDKRTQAWQIQLNQAQAELNKMERELQNNNKALENADKGFDKAEKSADEFGDEVESAAKQADDSSKKFEALGGVCKAVGAAIVAAFAAVSAAAVAAGKALVDMTREGAKYADSVLTESAVTGIATDKLQEYMYAAELVDVSTDTLTKSMAKQIKSMKSAADGSKSYVEAYEKLGVSVTDANGNLRDSDTVYWELIDALGKLENETERDALAMTILGKSAQELNPLIIAGADTMQELGEKAREAGYVIGEDMLKAYGSLDDQIQYLNVGATAAKNALGTVLLPILTDLATEGVSLLGEFTNGVKDANGDLNKIGEVFGEILPKAIDVVMKYVPVILDLIATVIKSIGKAIVDNLDLIVDSASEIILSILNGLIAGLPKIAEGALKLIITLVKGIIDNLPQILKAAIQVVVTLATGIAKALPELIPTIVKVVVEMCRTLIDNLPLILDAALQLVMGLVEGILNAIPELIAALPSIIIAIVDFIISAIPQIIDAGIKLLISLVEALPTIIAAIVEAIPKIIDGIINAVLEAIPLIIDAGVKLLIALVQNLPTIIMTIIEAIPTIISSVINALLGNIDKLIMAGVTLFTSIITNLPTIIIEIVKAIPKIIVGIVEGFGKGIGQMVEIGANLVKGLWEGIKSLASWIWEKVSGWASDLWDGIKNFFGIHSPSKKMAFIGDMLMQGLAGGIDHSAGAVIDSANDMKTDLNSVFDELNADLSAAPTDYNITKSVKGAADITERQGGGFVLQLNIDTFNNYSTEDINELTNEVMETAGNFIKRKGAVFA